jgi:hypothetical protein
MIRSSRFSHDIGGRGEKVGEMKMKERDEVGEGRHVLERYPCVSEHRSDQARGRAPA